MAGLTVSAPGHRNWKQGRHFLSEFGKIQILSKENNTLTHLMLLGAGRASVTRSQPRMKSRFFVRGESEQTSGRAYLVAGYTLG